MSTSEDQEWENMSISQLKVTVPAHDDDPPSRAPIVITRNASDSFERNYVEVEQQHLPVDSPIDDSLISALFNPREKMNVLSIEKLVVEFAESRAPFFNVPPMANSFQRLLVHRVADRFNIGHAMSETLYPNGEKSITLFRTEMTFIPKTLLIDILQAEQQKAAETVVRESPVAPGHGGKKIKFMKRNTSASGLDKKDKGSDKGADTLLDKEKAYAEARARIFAEEHGVAASPPPSAVIAAAISDTVLIVPTISKDLPLAPQVSKGISGASPSAGASANDSRVGGNATQAKVSDGRDPDEVNATSRRGPSKGKVDASSWKGNKSITKDRNSEQSDPDFARGRGQYFASAPYGYPSQPYDAYHSPDPYNGGAAYGMQPSQYGYEFGPPVSRHPPPSYGYGYPGDAYAGPPLGYPPQGPMQQRHHSSPPLYDHSPYVVAPLPPRLQGMYPNNRSPQPDIPSNSYNNEFPPLG